MSWKSWNLDCLFLNTLTSLIPFIIHTLSLWCSWGHAWFHKTQQYGCILVPFLCYTRCTPLVIWYYTMISVYCIILSNRCWSTVLSPIKNGKDPNKDYPSVKPSNLPTLDGYRETIKGLEVAKGKITQYSNIVSETGEASPAFSQPFFFHWTPFVKSACHTSEIFVHCSKLSGRKSLCMSQEIALKLGAEVKGAHPHPSVDLFKTYITGVTPG